MGDVYADVYASLFVSNFELEGCQMWLAFLLSIDHWHPCATVRQIEWPIGNVEEVCRDAAHGTIAFYVWKLKKSEKCFFSDVLYMDRESKDRSNPFQYYTDGLRTLKYCMGTREGLEGSGVSETEETQKEMTAKKTKKEMTAKKTKKEMTAKKTGKARLPQPKGSMSEEKQLQPRAHSEIAALQHLFNIQSGSNVMVWAQKIWEKLMKRPDYLYVVLFNSNHPPCGPGDRVSAKYHPETQDRTPCDQFLQAVVNRVNKDGFRFSIRVVYPRDDGGFDQAVYTHPEDKDGDDVQERLLNKVHMSPLNGNGASTKSHGKKRKSQQDAMLPRDLGEDLVDAALRLLLMILLDT